MTAETILRLDKVCKNYFLGKHIIKAAHDINFEIKQGELTSIIGPSGSGKSTLLHLMGLLDKPSQGEIQFLGKSVTNYKEEESARLRNRYLGFIFQQFNLLPKTSTIDNVLLPAIYNPNANLDQYREKAIKLLQDIGLGDRLQNYPNQLSGGQQQRVAIARALINDPKIIFADEPTGNLDSKSGQEVVEILKKLHSEGRTIIIVTHEKRLSDITTRRLHMLDGKIIKEKKL